MPRAVTTVVALTPDEARALGDRLAAEGFRLESRPHAFFLARGTDVTVTAYRSGKVLLTGRGAPAWAARLQGTPPPATPPAVDVPWAGSDESGKGDYFGPLVVAAVAVRDEAEALALTRLGVRDSKAVTDEALPRLAAAVAALPHEVVQLDPPEYNARYHEVGNLNELLARLHGDVLRRLAARVPVKRVVVDDFGGGRRLTRALGPDLARVLEMRPRAEDDPAVAAASVLARARFLAALRALSDDAGLRLPKGAGAPVSAVRRRLPPEDLARFAKMHFKMR